MNDIDWVIVENTETEFIPTHLHHKETVFTLSNGYLGTRGTFEEGYPGSCPATLINGVYDDAPIAATELANCPDWLSLTLIIEGDRFRLDQGKVLSYQRWLDLYQGVLSRRVRWRSPAGHTLDLHFERFVSLADQHVMALRCHLISVDYTGTIEVHTSLNGYTDNEGRTHWDWHNQLCMDNMICLQGCSRHSNIELGMAAHLHIQGAEDSHSRAIGLQGYPAVISQCQIQPGQAITLDKIATVFTSRDTPTPAQCAINKLATLPSYEALRTAHRAAWAAVWQDSDVVIEGDSTAQLAVRYNLFQMLSAAPRHDDRVSIPAKTLSGFAYKGHIFWDTEIFIVPCLTLTQPDLARNLLTYRYHTLAGARRKAEAAGYEGAMYAWESATTGDEVTPTWVPSCTSKDLVRIWCGDIELHITADVAYAIWHYWQLTGDNAWMSTYGAEMLLDTAVFWGSRAEWTGDRYEIRDVIGPDEYHDRINNNAFTNRMVQWHLQIALKTLDWLRHADSQRALELEQQLGLTSERLDHWQHIIEQLWIPQDETGLFEQFDGFFALEDLDLQQYEPRTRSMQVILGIEGASQRQVLKQADVLMLLYLMRRATSIDPSVASCDRQTLQVNWDYYDRRTDHTYGSSLGPAIHAAIACELGKPEVAYEHFMRAALVDLADVRGNAAEGIHGASTGGVWQALVFGFGGVEFTAEGPVAKPTLPAHWTRLRFNLCWQGQRYTFDLTPEPQIPAVLATVPPVQGVIFDLDGVLTDTAEFHYLGWKQLADEEGIPFDRQANDALRGVSRQDSLRRLLQDRPVTEAQFQEMMDRKNRYYVELIQTITADHLLPGVLDLLKDLKAAGIRVAIGSASKNARPVIQRLGIAPYIDAIADGNSVKHPKPAPDVFLQAASQLGLKPTTCVVVEDAASGIEAAMRAGMWSVGLGPQERVGDAHLVLPNLENVRWLDLQQRLFQAAQLLRLKLVHNVTLQRLTELQKASSSR